MADSNLERQRRFQAHRKGDHSMCRPEHCEGAVLEAKVRTAQVGPVYPVGTDISPGDRLVASDGTVIGHIESATRRFVESLPFGESDPRFVMAAIAIAMAQKMDQGMLSGSAIQQLRIALGQMVESPGSQADRVDEQRLAANRRALDAIIARELAA